MYRAVEVEIGSFQIRDSAVKSTSYFLRGRLVRSLKYLEALHNVLLDFESVTYAALQTSHLLATQSCSAWYQ